MTRLFTVFTLLAFLVPALPVEAQADAGFRKWVRDFKGVARKNGIKGATYDRAFAGVSAIDPDVLKKARYQPEFKNKFWQYFDSRVNDTTVTEGREMRRKWGRTLAAIEKKYGVDRDILLAIWSMETRYGKALETPGALRSVVRSLATLAYADKRRRKFARSQLIAALKMLQQGQVTVAGLQGSWAGAMGHTQFIPTSYRLYRQNFDGKGGADIWNSVPDALATAARLLQKNGWRTGQTWGYEVQATARLYKSRNQTLSIGQWVKRGVKRANGKRFASTKLRARLVFPAGGNGPAFLMLKNFYVLKRYNNATKYALAVGHLADRIAGGGEFVQPLPRPYAKLSEFERMEVQQHLAKLGLYDGAIDGRFGDVTRKGIRAAQKRFGMKADGYESPKLLKRLRSI